MSKDNVTVLKPKMRFDEVLREYGWCYPSKDVAHTLYYAHKGSGWALRRLAGVGEDGEPSKYRQSHYVKWAFLKDSKFTISSRCCEVMKEKPLTEHQKRTGKRAMIGTLAAESHRRKQAWLQTGCNAFDAKKQVSKPLSFWTEQDILRYLKEFTIPYAGVYGEIAEGKNGKLATTGETRTGCVFCPIGCHLDKENRFMRLARTHPKLYSYCIEILGLGELLDFVGVKY
jgi:3'-phosphoadenosine 5'-phosphosulfate sulfotransferase (PAPS reductase)/FAD synthetase